MWFVTIRITFYSTINYFNQTPSHSWPTCIIPNVTSSSRATLCYTFNLLIPQIFIEPLGGRTTIMNKTQKNPYFEDAYFLCKRGRLKINKVCHVVITAMEYNKPGRGKDTLFYIKQLEKGSIIRWNLSRDRSRESQPDKKASIKSPSRKAPTGLEWSEAGGQWRWSQRDNREPAHIRYSSPWDGKVFPSTSFCKKIKSKSRR